MKALDWLIVIAYLIYVIWDGIRLTKRSKSTQGFFLADRGLPWWAVGLSVMATQLSAITLVGTTGQAYADGMRFLQFYYGLPLAMIILCITLVPFFYKSGVYTAYEYLERRFDAKTRALTSFFFLISRGLGVGVVIAAPSVILSIVLGWNEVLTIFVIGLSTTIYTMFGGVQAVTWTDVKQMFIIFFGLGVCLFVIISQFPQGVSATEGLFLAGALGKLQTFDWRFDLTEKYTVWSGFFAALFLFLSYFGCDQSQVQRFLTAKSVSQGRISLLMSAVLKIPMQFFILLIGIMVFVFYQFQTPPIVFNRVELAKIQEKPEYSVIADQYENAYQARKQTAIKFLETHSDESKNNYIQAHRDFMKARQEAIDFIKRETNNQNFNDVNYVFPIFVVDNMPTGVIGLIIAAIFAAAMSTISAELNSLSTATTMDFYRRFFAKNAEDKSYVIFGRFATFFWGIFACIIATYSTNLGSLVEVVNKFGSFFYGPILGVFVLAIASKRANGNGAFIGILSGLLAVFLASSYSKIEFLWFNVVGCLVTVAIGYLVSIITKNSA